MTTKTEITFPFVSTPNVTDNGEAVEESRATTQAISYIPYGEVFVEQQSGGWSSPYLFNAKELDSETGLYYYGARYLDPSDAMWLSVDPLWEKYVGMTPYQYCAGNPVVMVDPDGMLSQNSEGQVEFEPDYSQEPIYSGSQNKNGPDEVSYVITYDNRHYKTNATYQPGYVTTDEGHKVPALKLKSLTLTEVSKDHSKEIGEPQELLGNEKLQKSLGSPAGNSKAEETIKAFSANCHGLTFADGQVWIAGNDVQTIINDEYVEINSASQKNDVVTIYSQDGIPQHSYIKNDWGPTGDYKSKDGRSKILYDNNPKTHEYNYNSIENYSKSYRRK